MKMNTRPASSSTYSSIERKRWVIMAPTQPWYLLLLLSKLRLNQPKKPLFVA